MVANILRITLFVVFFSVTATYGQSDEAIKKEQEKYIQKQFNDYKDRVDTFVNLLDIDDFKGQIIKQKIDEFYKNRNQIMMSEIPEYEKEPLIDQLLDTHFNDVKELYAEETLNSVRLFLKDNKGQIKKLQKLQKTKPKNKQ